MNLENSIIKLNPEKTHLLSISDGLYKRLMKIGEDSIVVKPTAEQVIGFLVNHYEAMMLYAECETQEEFNHRLLYGDDDK